MKIIRVLPIIIILLLIYAAISAQPCTLSCLTNIVIKADSSKEGATVTFPAAFTSGECGTLSYTPASGSFFRIGSHSIIATTSAGQKCAFTVTVTDNEAPVLSTITLSPKRVWPASRKMKKIAVNYTTSDNADEVDCSLTVSSNDPLATENDWEIVSNHMLRLRAKRMADGEPRVYSITVTCTDVAGNTTKRTTAIGVAKNIVAR